MEPSSSPTSAPPHRRRFGANYVPSNGWFYSWLDFRPDDVRRDFEDLAGLGLDHVRIFPVWPWVQPNRALVRPAALADLLTTVDLAAEAGLDVAVDLLQGHLSSFDFLPSWVLTWHRRSVFGDATVRDGLRHYVDTVTRAVATRENVFAVTLGNEVNNLWPSNETVAATSTEWARELVDVARAAAPGRTILHSLYDDAFYAPSHPFTPADVTGIGDVSSVHSWVFNGVAALDGPLGPATTSHADYLVELARAASPDHDRPVWLQEVGAPRPEIGEGDVHSFVHQALGQACQNPALWGVTWWCSHDLSRDLVDFPEREYDLGLFTTDHRPKPVARALAEIVADPPAPVPSRAGIVCDVDLLTEPQRRAEVAPGSDFHRRWVDARTAGPTVIVPAHRRDDASWLAARGVTELVPDPVTVVRGIS